MWVVGINRPYYPSVDFFAIEADAIEMYNELLKEHDGDDAVHLSQVFLAEIVELKNIRTHY